MPINPDNYDFNRVLISGYVDKTGTISFINPLIDSENAFLCIARPRSFGKSVTLKTLIAYYSKGCDSKDIFSKYEIAHDPSFLEHLNQHNVIYWDMSSYGTPEADFDQFLKEFNKQVIRELTYAYSDLFNGYQATDVIEALKHIKLTSNENLSF
jgi:hypothetical protein